MGGRADNIDNHQLDNNNFAVFAKQHIFAKRHFSLAFDDAIAERNLNHDYAEFIDYAERVIDQQLPGWHGSPNERERDRYDEFHDLDSKQLDQQHFAEQHDQQHFAEQLDQQHFAEQHDQQHVTEQHDHGFDLDLDQHDPWHH